MNVVFERQFLIEFSEGFSLFCSNPVVCGISKLELDHMSVLGDTIEQIAWHKSGIMKVTLSEYKGIVFRLGTVALLC